MIANCSKEHRSFRPESRIPTTNSFSRTIIESVTPREHSAPQNRGQLLHLIEDRAEIDEFTRGEGFSSTKHPSRDKFSFKHDKNSNNQTIKTMIVDYTYSSWSDRWITPVLRTSHASTWNLMLYDSRDLKLLQLV